MCVEVLRQLSYADDETADVIGQAWYYACCMDLMLEAGKLFSLSNFFLAADVEFISQITWISVLNIKLYVNIVHNRDKPNSVWKLKHKIVSVNQLLPLVYNIEILQLFATSKFHTPDNSPTFKTLS